MPIVTQTYMADTLSPLTAYDALFKDTPYHFLFESVEGGTVRGRYTIFGGHPDIIWQVYNGTVATIPHMETLEKKPPLESLKAFIAMSQIDPWPEHVPRPAAGIFGYMGYDMVRLMETLPVPPKDTLGIFDAVLIRPTLVVIVDHVKDTLTLASFYNDDGCKKDARKRLEQAVQTLNQAPRHPLKPIEIASPTAVNLTPHINQDVFEKTVNQAKEYIMAGDIFQVVLSQRWHMPYVYPSLEFYKKLRRLNPSPYLFHLHLNDIALVGSSPEILVRVDQGTVHIRPIAGTRPRGETPEHDAALALDLLNDAKERAEHLMLLDLGRNDVGRVAKNGTVAVTEEFSIERYSHVMHLVSHVVGTLQDGKTAIDALMAGFPAGTVSGAPKVRAMEIIDTLEQEKRNFYGGAVGYFAANGDMDTCIALRTALIKDNTLYIQAGAGIVAHSDPSLEFQETVNKAKALANAAVV
jgi:anthranilate synthase component I